MPYSKIGILSIAMSIFLLGSGCAGASHKISDQPPISAKQSEASKNSVATSSVSSTPVVSTSTVKNTSTVLAKPAPVKSPTKAPPKTTAPQSASTAYVNALNIYQKSGYYFQLVKCTLNPGTMTLKKGVKYMLDNRNAETHTLAIGTKRVVLSGYNFAIVTADTVGTHNITCDGGGTGKLVVQP
jgi:hypothetical protein